MTDHKHHMSLRMSKDLDRMIKELQEEAGHVNKSEALRDAVSLAHALQVKYKDVASDLLKIIDDHKEPVKV